MRYLSVCSGIAAASTAWHPLGWSPVAFAEIEAFPCAVLKHHYPKVPNWGDITKFKEWPDATIDVLVGGTPCQSFSVAGLRQGLADPRGNLALTFLAIADKYRPAWILWENVPGVLSSDGGRDFGAFLGGLGQLGYGWSYRVLDAQYVRTHGHPRAVPQRRRRVFVVGYLGDWRRAAAVLFESEGMSGHSAPRRQAGERTSGPIAGCSNGGGANGPGRTADDADSLISIDVAKAVRTPTGGIDHEDMHTLIPTVADPISANEAGTYTHEGKNNFRLHNCVTQEVANPLTHRMHKGINTTMDEGQTMVAHSLTTMGRGGDVTEDGTGRGCPIVPVAHALRADGFDASEDGTGRGTPLIAFQSNAGSQGGDLFEELCPTLRVQKNGGGGMPAIAFPCKDTGADASDIAPTMRAMGHDGSHANAGGQLAVAFHENQRGELIASDTAWAVKVGGGKPGQGYPAVAFTMNLMSPGRQTREDDAVGSLTADAHRPTQGNEAVIIQSGWAVRRLTPRECERLQGFPDGYTQVPYRGKPAADGPRYKALGNSMAVNVMQWLGTRIQMVDDIDKENGDDQAG